jgi:hypothetical protein
MALLGSRNVTIRLALLACIALRAHADIAPIDEYQVKAAFLYNFAKFVEWPREAFGKSTDPIGICVIGQNPFGSSLEDAVSGKTVNGRAFVVRQISDIKQASRCHILFVSASERRRYSAILGDARAGGVLTVGETDGFAEQGGMVNLKLESGRVQIQINLSAAEEARVRISSKLLSLAQIIQRPVQPK